MPNSNHDTNVIIFAKKFRPINSRIIASITPTVPPASKKESNVGTCEGISTLCLVRKSVTYADAGCAKKKPNPNPIILCIQRNGSQITCFPVVIPPTSFLILPLTHPSLPLESYLYMTIHSGIFSSHILQRMFLYLPSNYLTLALGLPLFPLSSHQLNPALGAGITVTGYTNSMSCLIPTVRTNTISSRSRTSLCSSKSSSSHYLNSLNIFAFHAKSLSSTCKSIAFSTHSISPFLYLTKVFLLLFLIM